jgi:hypothetical protein
VRETVPDTFSDIVGPMTPAEQAEFEALRATIRERGTVRPILFVGAIAAWAAAVIATTALFALPVSSLLSLLVLAAGFEATASLHFGVERIGRYLQARYERRPLWETTVMNLAGRTPGAGSDALFSPIYLLASVANFVPVALTALTPELVALGAFHALFVWRVFALRRASAVQRQVELKVFREILDGGESARQGEK